MATEAYNLESNKLIKGTRCWVRVNLNGPDSSGAEKIGFVQSASISANFQNDRAEVIGEILPVTIDVSSVQTSVQLTGFVPTKKAAGQKTTGSGDGESHFSVKNFNPDIEKITGDKITKIAYLDLWDDTNKQVIGYTTWLSPSSYSENISGKGYMTCNCSLEGIGFYNDGATYKSAI